MIDEQAFNALQQQVRALQDRQDILDCIVREARGRDRHDAELTASCYWPEGYDEHGPQPTPALEYPERANAGHKAFFAANAHNITNHTCAIAGDTAYCESYVVGGLLSLDERTCKIAMGRYIDQMERRDGEWRILRRRSTVEMVCEGDATWLHSPAVKGFLRGLRTRDDISYKRPVAVDPDDPRW
ncbi:MAG: nuclear transport factor 2 family protein [Novosphingobium sp.]